MRATFRGSAGPLPQVHPGKWYPSVGAWPAMVGVSDASRRVNGSTLSEIRFGRLASPVAVHPTLFRGSWLCVYAKPGPSVDGRYNGRGPQGRFSCPLLHDCPHIEKPSTLDRTAFRFKGLACLWPFASAASPNSRSRPFRLSAADLFDWEPAAKSGQREPREGERRGYHE